jgi:hypothetical protein
MTEAEWLRCEEPEQMLGHVARLDLGPPPHPGQSPRRLTGRKMRLLTCAYGRRLWHRLTDERARRAVEVAERLADGEATEAERGQAAFAPRELGETVPPDSPALAALRAAMVCRDALWAPDLDHMAPRWPPRWR